MKEQALIGITLGTLASVLFTGAYLMVSVAYLQDDMKELKKTVSDFVIEMRVSNTDHERRLSKIESK